MHILNKITWRSIPGKKINIFIAIGGGLVLFIALFLLLLAPVRRSIAVKKEEWKKLEAQIIENRSKIDSLARIDKSAIESELEDLRRKLPSKSSASAVLDELTKRGRELNIELISIAPQDGKTISPSENPAGALKYKILPIEINMRAGYRSLGEYLGIVEKLDTGFATVGGFQIAKDPKAPPKLNVRLVVYTYILEDQSGQR